MNLENLQFFSCFAAVAALWYIIGRWEREMFWGFFGGLITILLALVAFTRIAGTVSPEFLLKEDKTYFLSGSPYKSPDNQRYVVALYLPGEKERMYYSDSLPPKGFKLAKTDDGRELYVPEK